MAGPIEILSGFALVILLLYYYLTFRYDFWKDRGIVGPRPGLVFGNFKDQILKRIHIGVYLKQLYDAYKSEAVVGIFVWRTPELLLRDLDIIKDVMIKDFSTFADRGSIIPHRAEPMQNNLLHMQPVNWRNLRVNLTPTFSSGKLKDLYKFIFECANNLERSVEKMVEKGEPIECDVLCTNYTTDVIGTCIFGLDVNPMPELNHVFREMSLELTKPTLEFALRKSMLFYASRIYDILGYVLPWPPETKFFTDLISRAIRHRRENNIVRNDFVDTLMQIEQHPEKLPGIDVTTQFLAAQAYLFYIAGFDTSANTMSNVLYELALNPDIQEKLRKEIFDLSGNSGKIQIEDIKQMSYLDQVIKETLRKYPISTDLVRRSTKSYTFQKIGLTIPEGLIVRIPVYAIHHDPNIYPEPDVFNPERFSKENQETRHQMSYLPFGNGPRICLGLRFANFQVKIGITTILQKYKIERCDKTIIPYVVNPRAFFLQPKDQTVVKFTKLNGIQSQKVCYE